MLEEIDPLPCPQRKAARFDRNGYLHLRQRRADMRWHIVRPLRIMHVQLPAFRCDPRKKAEKIFLHIGIGIFLYEQRSRRMPAEQSQKPHIDFLRSDPLGHLTRKLKEALAFGLDENMVKGLPHSQGLVQDFGIASCITPSI